MYTNVNMTIYNKYINKETQEIVFKKHLIDKVFWDDSKGINLNKGYDKADSVNVYIPKDLNDFTDYKTSKDYKGLGWTINEGDFIVKGETDENEVVKLSELTSKYNNVFTITLVDDKDFGSFNMRHFEIRGN